MTIFPKPKLLFANSILVAAMAIGMDGTMRTLDKVYEPIKAGQQPDSSQTRTAALEELASLLGLRLAIGMRDNMVKNSDRER